METRDNLVAFRLTDSEFAKLLNLTRKSKDFLAKGPNEAAKFTLLKELGCWYRRNTQENLRGLKLGG